MFYEDEVEEKKTKHKSSHTPQTIHQTWECGKPLFLSFSLCSACGLHQELHQPV